MLKNKRFFLTKFFINAIINYQDEIAQKAQQEETMNRQEFIKVKISMGFTWYEALCQWNNLHKEPIEKDDLEIYMDTLEAYHN